MAVVGDEELSLVTMLVRAGTCLLIASALAGVEVARAQSNAGGNPGTGLSLDERTSRQIRSYEWDKAIATYRAAIAANARDADAWRGLGRVLRWKGRLAESRDAYAKAAEIEPDNPGGVLGMAASYRFDHDFKQARLLYDQAALRWKDDEEVAQDRRQFELETDPRVYAFYEDDLSFETRKVGAALPLLSREEVYLEHEREKRPDVYERKDTKLGYIHFFGRNQALELSARFSDYDYELDVTDFAAIRKFVELRAKYSHPITPDQVVTVRYTHRPTVLENGNGKFASKKIEAELRSQWSPRFSTVVGTGALRDLDDDAEAIGDLRTTILVRGGFEYAFSPDLQVSANYITNPDLDNTIHGTTLAQLNYRWSNAWSSLYRFRFDDYKEGSNQNAHYLGMRYSPGGPIWGEFGAKYVSRDNRDGIYPLISIVYRCGFCAL